MHEIGMLYSAAETAVCYADRYDMSEVKFIALELGELAGVLPEVFTQYFDYVKQQFPKLAKAELQMKMIPGEGLCSECGCMYNVMRNEGKCPCCASREKKVLSGRDVRLISIA